MSSCPEMPRPEPAAVRLTTRAKNAVPPRPPLGARAWSDEADATVILLDASGPASLDPANVASQLPEATTFAGGTPLVVLGDAARGGPAWRRLLRADKVSVPRAARCTALLARGYVDVGGGLDESTGADLAWGWSPR